MIRRAIPADVASIIRFQEELAMETEGLSLDRETVVGGVEAVMQDPTKGMYLVAEEADVVIGSLLLTFEWSDWRNGQIAWVQSVFVEEASRRKGVYRSLYGEVKRLAREKGWKGIRLYVERSNLLAKSVYRGLSMTGDHYEVMEDMKL